MKCLAGEFVCRRNDLQQNFSFSQQEKQPVRKGRNDSFSALLSFLPTIIVSEYAQGGFVGQTGSTKWQKVSQLPPHWRKAQKSFENNQVRVIQKCSNQSDLNLIGRLLTKVCDKNKK